MSTDGSLAERSLHGRTAIVYGGGGFVGGAVARAFASEGASVHLVGRTLASLERTASSIVAAGGVAEVEVLDVLDEVAVDAHADAVARRSGLDVVFNGTTFGDIQGAPLAELALEHLTDPVMTALRGQFLTVRAAARHMVERGAGVILTITGYGPPAPELGATALTWNLVEGLYRQWSCELGPKGVRVAWLRTGGFEESILGVAAYDTIHDLVDGELVPVSETSIEQARETLEWLAAETHLRRLPSLDDAGAAAAFLASDRARSITAGAINLTSGAVCD